MKKIFMMLIPLMSLARPDTTKAYIVGSKPLTAIRFFSNGTFQEHSYEKADKKEPRIPIKKTDSGRYFEGRFGILLKGKKPRFMRYDNKKEICSGLLRQNRIRKAEASMYPTIQEWERLEWIRKNRELYIKQSQEYIKTKAINSIKKWCPEYMLLVDSAYCGPGCYNSMAGNKTIMYAGDTNIRFPDELETLIHESTHRYNKEVWEWGQNINHRYMITPGHDLWARHTKLYASSEFIAIVPKDAPTKIFRYGLYVGPGSHVSANSWGIYGMMDEFSAYYNGARSAWIGYHMAKSRGDKKSMEIFEQRCLGTYFAWYEFRTFAGWYLTYAKMKHPDVYKETMENRDIAKVFAELDRQFGDMAKEIEKEFAGHATLAYYEKEYVSYLRPIMKGLEPILTEFKAEKKEEPKAAAKKKKS
jgi:signal peptidase I